MHRIFAYLLILIASVAMAEAPPGAWHTGIPADVSGPISTHEADTTAVHGISDTSAIDPDQLAGDSTDDDLVDEAIIDADITRDSELTTHESDTSSVHGQSDFTNPSFISVDAGAEYSWDNTVGPTNLIATDYMRIYLAEYAGSKTYNLPAEPETAAGKSKLVKIENLAAQVRAVNPDDADIIHWLADGEGAMTAGEALISTGAIGESITCVGYDDGSNDKWACRTTGSWAQETP